MRGRVRTAERLALLAAGLFVVGTNAFVIAGVLPSIAGELHAPQTAVASSITWYAAVVAIASPLVGVLLPRVPRTALIAVGLVLVAAGTVVAALAPGLLVFIAGRVLAAFGGAALVPTATAAAPAMLRPSSVAWPWRRPGWASPSPPRSARRSGPRSPRSSGGA